MSVRLRPSIRCTFEEEQGVLRIALKELDQESNEQHIVIYALKVSSTSIPLSLFTNLSF